MWGLVGLGLIAIGVAVLIVAAVGHKVVSGIFREPVEPETYGDSGGDPAYALKIIAGLKDAVAHARGEPNRVEVTQYPRRIVGK